MLNVWLCQGHISRKFFILSNANIISTSSAMVDWGIRTAGHLFIHFHRPKSYYPILAQFIWRVMWSIIFTWRPSSDYTLTFNTFVFLSETTIPFENKLGRNVLRIVIFTRIKYSTLPPDRSKLPRDLYLILLNWLKQSFTWKIIYKVFFSDHRKFTMSSYRTISSSLIEPRYILQWRGVHRHCR